MNRNIRPSAKGSELVYKSKQYDGKIAGLYDLEETLGRGHFAVVKLARHVFTGEKVAVKVIDKNKLDEVSKAHLFQEVRCMKLVQHPNVVRLYDVIDTATKLYLILELGDGGDLYEYIMRHDTGLPEHIAKEYFSQIVRAISYCHQLHVVHRDLKPENVVFFKKQGVVKLTDFGFSNKFYPGQKLETSCGSLAYSAPEILLGDSYDAPAVDVWSLGVILFMLVCGQAPFQEANDSETLTMIMDCKYEIPAHVSQNCRKLICRMLLRSPEKRATLAEISDHPWLSNNKQNNADAIPLVSKEQLSEEDHNLIVQKIANGKIATKEEIQESLEKNEYNHVTATYYLLAERKLRTKRQEQGEKTKRPEELAVNQNDQGKKDNNVSMKPSLLTVPRTPGDLPQRSRKCSIVQEDEEEEDMTSCSRRDDLGGLAALNRRGSRSEGRLNLAVQERLIVSSESEKSKAKKTPPPPCKRSAPLSVGVARERPGSDRAKKTAPPVVISPAPFSAGEAQDRLSVGVARPLAVSRAPLAEGEGRKAKPRPSLSCSSSDASDDDSEKRKKRGHGAGTGRKLEGRRDSCDDSSDSQEASAGGGGGLSGGGTIVIVAREGGGQKGQENKSGGGYKGDRGRKKPGGGSGGRLRESRSLNRITEVQEEAATTQTPASTPRVKMSVGAKILHSVLRPDADAPPSRRLRVLGKYFHVHKKLAGLFRGKGGGTATGGGGALYKARSCGSLAKDRVGGGGGVLACGELRIGHACKCSFC